MSMVENYEIVHFVADAALFITLIATFSICIQTCCTVSRRKDPARHFLSWFKAAFIFYTIYVFLRFCSLILVTITSRLFEEESYGGGFAYGSILDRVFFVVLFGAQLFNNIADVLLAVALIGVYLGLRHARSSEPPRYNMLFYRVCYGFVAFLVTVQVTVFIMGFFEAFSARDISHFYDWGYVKWGYSFTGYEYWTVLYALGLIAAPIMCIAALTIFGLSISARRKTRRIPHLRRITKLYIVCSCLMLLKQAYAMYFAVLGYQNVISLNSVGYAIIEILDILFSIWPGFIIFTILFSEGMRRRDGLRSGQVAPLMQEIETSGLAPTTSNTDLEAATPIRTAPEPAAAVTSSTTSPTSPLHATQQQQTGDSFPWAVQSDEAPPEYELPSRPSGQSAEPSTELQAQTQVATASTHVLSPVEMPEHSYQPPSHDEAMGLYHQADGMAPRTEALPYDKKKN